MPEMSGYEFIEKLRGNLDLADIQVIILTSGGREGDRLLREQLGISERLMKPVKQSELFDSIVRALGVSAPEVAVYDHRDEGPDLGKLRILLAEDNIINQKLAIGVLEKYGHEITVANNGQEAVQLLEEKSFDVVLMDVQMPVMDGMEATRLIRENEAQTGKRVPIIAMTAHAMKGDREKCIEAGMDEYVAKPIRIAMLCEKLADVLGVRDRDQSPDDHSANDDSANDEPVDDDFAFDDSLIEELADDELEDDDSPNQELGEIDSAYDELADDDFLVVEQPQQQPSLAASDLDNTSVPNVDATNDAIDWEKARITVAGDVNLLSELLRVYLGEVVSLMGEIRQAIDTTDRAALKRAAHTLKGASQSVGAIRTSEIAELLEIADDDEPAETSRVFSMLEAAVKQVIAVITARLSSK